MKKHTKTILISLGALALITTIGGSVMAINYLNNRFDAYVKAKKGKEEKAQERKIQEEEQAVRDEQLAYLKEHQQEIKDFVKSQNPKIESVQIDWDSMEVEQGGNGTPQGGDINLSIDGKINNLENTKFSVDFYLENFNDIPNVSNMRMLNHIYIYKDGVWRVYS